MFLSVGVFAQLVKEGCHKTSEGTDFWIGFLESRNYNAPHYLELLVCAREQTSFTLTVGPEETRIGTNYTVNTNDTVKVRIPWQLVEADSSEFVENKGLHLVSEKPVVVFALNYDKNSNDIATIFPTETLGTEYFAICYTPSVDNSSLREGRNSEFLIVATEDNTKVTITPTAETDRFKSPPGVPFDVILNRGQVYQVQSKNVDHWTLPKQGDLTGTQIKSDKNIAVFSGSLAAMVPATAFGYWDHLFEQVPPVHAWGREFYTVPFERRKWDRIRVLASQDNTVVTIAPDLGTYRLNKGQYKEVLVEHTKICHIQSDKRILVAQYSLSQSEDAGFFSGANNEPFMVIIPPIEQMRNNAIFISYPGKETIEYWTNIICKPSEIDNIMLDGQKLEMLDATNGIYFQKIKLTDGAHTILNKNQDGGLLAISYSFGSNESFGYPSVFRLDKLLDLGASLSFEGDTILLCKGTSQTLDAGADFVKYLWSTGDTTRTITLESDKVATGDQFWLKVFDENGCSQSDTVVVFVSNPVTDLGINDTATCAPYSQILDAGSDFESYSWSSGQNTQTIQVTKTGNYVVTVTDKYGCRASDSVKITVHPIPEINFVGPTLVCDSKEATISVSLTGADPSLWDFSGSTWWSKGNPWQPEFVDIVKDSVRIKVSDWGEYLLYYHLKTRDSCLVVKGFKIGFYETPTANFEILDNPDNPCSEYDQEIRYTGIASDTASFLWDFSGSLITRTIEPNRNFNVSLGLGKNPKISLVVNDQGCISPEFSLDLRQPTIFDLKISPTRGCDTATVLFDIDLKIPDEVHFDWSMGDGKQETGNTVKHRYSYPDFFDVGLVANNTTNRCVAKWLLVDTIKIYERPEAKMSIDENACYPDTIQVIYLNNNDSSICHWIPDGLRIIENRNDTIRTVLDNQRSNLSLWVEEFGCKGDISIAEIDRIPHLDLVSTPSEGCEPLVVFSEASSNDDYLVYFWMTDKNSTENKTRIDTFSYPGLFDYKLITQSKLTGCRNTILRPGYIQVNPKPQADFEVDHPNVYLDNAAIQFTNLSYGATQYYWDFGDGNRSENTHPKYQYNQVGSFFPQLIADSEFGCSDTTIIKINVLPYLFFAPNAFRPDSEIEENRYFMPLSEEINPENLLVRIFDRWGQIIFESDNILNKWDGRTPNGEKAPMGNYVWTAVYTDVLGFTHNEKGQVLLIR